MPRRARASAIETPMTPAPATRTRTAVHYPRPVPWTLSPEIPGFRLPVSGGKVMAYGTGLAPPPTDGVTIPSADRCQRRHTVLHWSGKLPGVPVQPVGSVAGRRSRGGACRSSHTRSTVWQRRTGKTGPVARGSRDIGKAGTAHPTGDEDGAASNSGRARPGPSPRLCTAGDSTPPVGDSHAPAGNRSRARACSNDCGRAPGSGSSSAEV